MKKIMIFGVLALSQTAFSGEGELSHSLKVYTPHIVVDNENHGKKGAVRLYWQKLDKQSEYELELTDGITKYRNVDENNFHYVMIYFEKDYYWRVRSVDLEKQSRFSPWRPLKVVQGEELSMERQLSSQKKLPQLKEAQFTINGQE